MKRIMLMVAIGVSCFLAGVIVSALWFRYQYALATEDSPEPAFNDTPLPGGDPLPVGRGRRGAKFATLDTDHDGKLSPAEFGAGRSPREAAKWFGRRDTDHDGFLSPQEFLPFAAGEGR